MRKLLGLMGLLVIACGSRPESKTAPISSTPTVVSATRVTGECPSHIERSAPLSGSIAPPAGWVSREAPAPASETIECANLSKREWKITGKNGEIDVSLRTLADAGDKIPFSFRATKKDEAALHGTPHVHPSPSGYWVGFDAGEYGGALYEFSADGKSRSKLSSENVIGFADLRIGTIAVTGLAHMGMSVGHLLKIVTDASGDRAEPWIDLGDAADTFVVESPESMLVLTTGGLTRVTACGDVNQIARTNYDALYPSSMAVDSRGIVYIGMRQFVVRWIPQAIGYREEWLTKDDCTAMTRDKFECRCRAGS